MNMRAWYTQQFPDILVCAQGVRTEFPGDHFKLHPKSGGFIIGKTQGDSRKTRIFAKLTGLPSSLLIPKNVIASKVLLVDSTDLDPRSLSHSLIRFIKRRYKMRRSFGHTLLTFIVESYSDMMFDPLYLTMEDELERLSEIVDVFAYWPDMPKMLFYEIFGYFHPGYTAQEALAEAELCKEKAKNAIDEGDLSEARLMLQLTDTLLDYADDF